MNITPKELHKKITEYFDNNEFCITKDKPFNYPTQKELLKHINLSPSEYNELKYNSSYNKAIKLAKDKMMHSLKYQLSCLLRKGNIKKVLDELSLNHGIFIEL